MPTNQQWYDRLENTMAWGSSTSSKSARLLPEEPTVMMRGKGCHTWDADGREFIDFKCGLGPVTLGYCFPAVNDAIKAQLDNGIVFSTPTALECEVSEMLCDIIPCAEQAKFLKTGGEACAACIRLARAYTGRDHIIQIGYNGWLNVLGSGARILPSQATVATNRLPGVPECVSNLFHTAGWGDEKTISELFDEFDGKIAAVIVSMGYPNPEIGKTFYPFLRQITEKNGALLIYDEIVTGFRVALGGVQEYFGVKPDLAVFAKGIANGMPISTYLGRRDVMQCAGRGKGVSISSTYGGETLSLAACKAVMEVYKTQNVIEHIWAHGNYLWDKLDALFKKYNYALTMKGFPCCKAFTATADAKGGELDAFMRGCFANGIVLYSTSYINFSHQYSDLDEVLVKMENVLQDLTK